MAPKQQYKVVDVKYSGKKARSRGNSVTNLDRNQVVLVVEVG